jgi:hypothetical protein
MDFTIDPNAGASSKPYSFTLKAVGPGGTATGVLSLSQPVAPAATVDILSLNSSPASLPGAGTASLTVSAALTGANQCAWSMDGGAATTVACTTSSSRNFGLIAPNPGPAAISHSFELDVTGPGGTASETLTMSQPPVTAPGPSITSITPSPASLTSDGGTLNIALAVSGASTCSITGDHGVVGVSGANCSSGSYNRDFAIHANTSGSDITYTFDVTATSAGNSATGSLSMTQPAAVPPGPEVTGMASSPKTVDYHGGTFTITAHVKNAAHCTMTSNPDVGSKGSTGCSGGSFTGTVTFPQNDTTSSKPYTVTVQVTGTGNATASGTLTYYVPPKPS